MLKAASRRLFLSTSHRLTTSFFGMIDQIIPMTYASNLFFTGMFDRPAFEAALADAIDAHPLMSALIQPAKQGKLCWVDARA